ncbi:VCBS repeat-containing protein, partial [Nodularia spumigena CS-1038]
MSTVFHPRQFVLNNFGHPDGWSSQNTRPRQLGDVNGDGRVDIIGFGNNGTYIAFGQSDGTFSQLFAQNLGLSAENTWSSFDEYPRLVGDVNGDGKDDIVAFGLHSVYV